MTKKDFILIAAVVHKLPDNILRVAVATEFATALATTNPLFDRARFLTACGVKS